MFYDIILYLYYWYLFIISLFVTKKYNIILVNKYDNNTKKKINTLYNANCDDIKNILKEKSPIIETLLGDIELTENFDKKILFNTNDKNQEKYLYIRNQPTVIY
jgi:hypothetical protein